MARADSAGPERRIHSTHWSG